jgi:large subunit ribosomal protein L35Ae
MSTATSSKSGDAAAKKKSVKRVQGRHAQPVRLYVKGAFIGYQRSMSNQYNRTALLAIDGVKSAAETQFYQGKRVAYIYRAHRVVKGSHYRVIWGRVASPHGNNGVVKAKFRNNLPPKGLGASVRVFLYPSKI